MSSNEIRRLLASLVLTVHHNIDHVLAWSRYRQRRQTQARTAHYHKRFERLTSDEPP